VNQISRLERALLVGIVMPGMTRIQEEESLKELASLASTAGAKVVDSILQERSRLEPSTFIGKGKVHQIARHMIQTNADLVIFDEDLSPVQVKNLEKEFNKKVLDRSALILDIFAKRARSRESQIQVELAQLQYYLPRLTRQWTHLSRQEGVIGTRGPGETQLEVDRRVIRKRISHLKKELSKIELQRKVRRKGRQEYKKVAMVGYTNVGKSSLLNAMTEADVLVEDQLFATLDATIRLMPIPDEMNVLLIDTVGFIKKLPHHLIASFRSTLEETVDADLLMHIIDISHSQFEEQIGSVQSVLRELGIDRKPRIPVFNKVDLLGDRRMMAPLKRRYPHAVFTSAVRGIGLESLRYEVMNQLRLNEVVREIRIPIQSTRIMATVYQLAHVLNQRYEDGVAIFQVRTTETNVKRIVSLLEKDENNTHINRR
jgi:GTP-binding protein HflX